MYILHVVGAMNIGKWYILECKINTYFALFCLQCATYQVLATTFDKYVAAKWPHRAAVYSTPKRAVKIILTIFGLSSYIIYPTSLLQTWSKVNVMATLLKVSSLKFTLGSLLFSME